MNKRFWLTGALMLLCAFVLSAAVYYSITIPSGETLSVLGVLDGSGASAFRLKTGTSDPSACSLGDILFRTDLTAGSNLKGCTTAGSPGTWTALGGSVSGGTWTAVTYQNSFQDQGSGWQTVQYAKDGMGFVHLRGMATSSAIGSISSVPRTIFTLPSGYRPPADVSFSVQNFGNSTFHIFKIDTSGVVALQTTTVGATFFVFDGLNFSVN